MTGYKLTLATLALAASTTFAFADGHANKMETLDKDADTKLSMEEYSGNGDRVPKFMAYDTNKDGMIDQSEFDAGEFSRADKDGDKFLTAEEYDFSNADKQWYEDAS